LFIVDEIRTARHARLGSTAIFGQARTGKPSPSIGGSAAYQIFGRHYQPGVPDNAYLHGEATEETMNLNLLKKCAVW
jgi:hypothetical protein